jgi:hypothetical protein
MHSVHNGVSPWIKERRPLGNESKHIEKTFPEFIHGKHFMRSVSMMKEGLAKKRKKPMGKKKNKNRH